VKPRELLVLVVLGVNWGSSFLFIKVAVEDLSPLMLVEGRMILGALTVVLTARALGLSLPRSRRLWLDASVMAVLNNIVPFTLISWAEEHIASGSASVLNASMPLFAALLAPVFIAEEGMTVARAMGLFTGFLGVAIFSGADLPGILSSNALGNLAVLAAALSYAAAAVFAVRRLSAVHPLTVSAGQLVSGVVLLTPVAVIWSTHQGVNLGVDSGLSLLALGVLGTGFAYVLYLWFLTQVGPVKGSLITYIVPVTGLALGWAVLDEALSLTAIGGLALIVSGIALVSRAASRQPRPAQATCEARARLDKERLV
jgi:drug/metabolite transporter (DMT)-like permease